MIYEIFSIDDYKKANNNFIKSNAQIYNNISDIIEELKKDKKYHFRIHKNTNYILFGDIDGFKEDINIFLNNLIDFYFKYYNIKINKKDIKYTKNNKKENSYHYSIPSYYCLTEKQKEINKNFIIYLNKIYDYSFIDTTIFSEHWFRAPEQSKGYINNNEKHIIIEGKMKDFILNNIPKKSININNINYISNETTNDKIKKNNIDNKIDDKIKKNNIDNKINDKIDNNLDNNKNNNKNNNKDNKNNNKDNNKDNKDDNIENDNKNVLLNKIISKENIIKRLFNECYKKERFNNYNDWISVGMALKNTFFDNENTSFELFDYFSKKGKNYEGLEKTKFKYNSFNTINDVNKYTLKTIYYYSIEDNKEQFKNIMNDNIIDINSVDICKIIKIIAGNKFIYINENNEYNLYCYNGKFWKNDEILFREFISNELYDFLELLIKNMYITKKKESEMKSEIKKLRLLSFKKEIIETYKEFGYSDIKFDDKSNLFCFNNIVYDLNEKKFRDYKYDDYVSTTTGYKWVEPTNDEIETLNNIIKSIMPLEDERKLFLQILASGLDGRCIEHFIIFNGDGRNGKGLINDLMLCMLGPYGFAGNNAILYESSKTGSNPEKANIHKKRYVIFREPEQKNKFSNGVIKELTGGGSFSARTHNEKETIKELNLTMVVECNKRPLFSEEPQNAEIERIIDIHFRSNFVKNIEDVDEKNNYYLGNDLYKEKHFKEKHKYALFKILSNIHSNFNSSIKFDIPVSVKTRTNLYLEKSCNILQWFKEYYELDLNTKESLQLKDVYNDLITSSFWNNLSKLEKQKYSRLNFIEYIKSNIYFRKYYKERHNNIRNVIINWIKKNEDSDEDKEDDNKEKKEEI